jgi:formylglycine-generating enzyme required for sulfatase activity
MVYVPPGDFTMGDDASPQAQARPAHAHPLAYGYYIGRFPTTWKEYRAFCQAVNRPEMLNPGFPTTDAHPIVNVSWNDAKEFCEWAGLRLPTEAEWEKAARGTDGRAFPWGNEFDPKRANFADASCPEKIGKVDITWRDTHANDGHAYTSPVGAYVGGASPYGALDMAGNVRQWCADGYEEAAYQRYAEGRLEPPADGSTRVLRGGGWASAAADLRSAARGSSAPATRSADVGFRPVKGP